MESNFNKGDSLHTCLHSSIQKHVLNFHFTITCDTLSFRLVLVDGRPAVVDVHGALAINDAHESKTPIDVSVCRRRGPTDVSVD